jgi:hypothetical protein
MDSYIICPKRDSKKVALAVCLNGCPAQWECDPFNRAAAGGKEVQPKEPVEETESAISEEKEQSEDTDVREETPKRVPAVQARSKAQELYEQVLGLKFEIESCWFELGKILEEIFEGRYYIPLGYTNWKDFCEVALGPLDLKWRAIDYLRMTRKKCDEVGIGREIAGEIGWSRLKEIIPVVTRKNRDHWIDVARRKETTVQVLNAKVRVARGKITEEESKIIPEKMLFALFKEQKEIVELALDVASKVAASDKNGYLLADVICPSFLAEYPVGAEVGKRPEMIARLLGRFEAAFKVKFAGEVTDLETGEILAGSR